MDQPRWRRWALPALTRRAIVRILRQPSLWVPILAFPLLLSAVFNSALASAADLPGFPVGGSYIAFSMPTALLQATILAAIACGTERAVDIETRFDDRLLLSPVSRTTTTLGTLLCGAVVSGAASAALLGVFRLVDRSPPSARAASVAIVGLYALIGAGLSGLVVAFASRTGSVQSVLAAYPSFMLLTFFSTALVPGELMAPWFAAIATKNPISWMLTDVRELYTGAWSTSAYLSCLGLAATLCAGSGLLVVPANRRRSAV